VYLEQRRAGRNDLGDMLMQIGSSFEDFDMEDAFVGPWDIANKVLRSIYYVIDQSDHNHPFNAVLL
jgi:hypothetical protein